MSFRRLWKIFFSVMIVIGMVACESQTEEERNVEAQNQRVYVKNLENRILAFVDGISKVNDEILKDFSKNTELSIDLDSSQQARIEARLIIYQVDLEALLQMYQEVLSECDSCKDKTTSLARLEERIISVHEKLSETFREIREIDSNEEKVAKKATPDLDDSLKFLISDEAKVVNEIATLTKRVIELKQEKSDLLETLNFRGHSERVNAIDAELTTIANDHLVLREELIVLRSAIVEA